MSVGWVLEHCEVYSNAFPSRFKHATGLTIRCYIEEKRMLAAMRLLSIEELDVHGIAVGLGYASYSTFNRAFQRFVGCTASEFRTTLKEMGTRIHFDAASELHLEGTNSSLSAQEIIQTIREVQSS